MERVTVVVVASARRRLLCRSLLNSDGGVSIVGEGRTLLEALGLTARLRPAVLLLGGPQGRLVPPLALSAIRRQSPSTRLILLTAGPVADAAMLAAIDAGARGWLDESATPRFLGKAVRAVAGGEAWVPRRMAPQILQRLAHADRAASEARLVGAPPAQRLSRIRLVARKGHDSTP